MSNVLVGIIGVILFIGLALAGALFLGPRFQSATTDSQASALAQQLQQVDSAIQLYRLTTGTAGIVRGELDFLKPDFLKAQPANPTAYASANPTYNYARYVVYPHISQDQQFGGQNDAAYVMTAIGPATDARSISICQKLADQFNGGVVLRYDYLPAQTAGCDQQGNLLMAFRKL